MSGPPPPPPPPHGENPKTTAGGGPNLPSGKYDIFIIPEHSAGAGFLYLPSLKPQWNSFIAGVACTLAVVVMGNSLAPAFRAWWASFQGIGNMGVFLLMVAIGLGAWSLGRQGIDGPAGSTPGSGQTPRGGGSDWSSSGGFGGASSNTQPPPPNAGPQSPPPPPPPPQPETPRPERPQSSWQSGQTRAETPKTGAPKPDPPKTETPKGAWEKAREETRRREEERKAKEAEQKRREEAARRLRELREREAREREAREKETRERKAREEAESKARRDKEAQEKERLEKEVREKLEKELQEKTLREAREKLEREKELHETMLKEAREREAREREERLKKEQEDNSRKGSTYAYSAVGEKTNMWPSGKPPAASSQPASPAAGSRTAPPPAASTTKPPPQPTARTYVDTEEDAFSFRPYDKPKKPPVRKKSVSDFSETSWAPSASTARTSPPPSVRSPYTTSDPQKIVIRAVYGFLNQFSKTPASQLVSGVGTVTDGLILRITSAGLFVDDDVRGVAQREWDVKAWTLKLIEVWCPTHVLASASASAPGAAPANHPFFKSMPGTARSRAAERNAPKTFTGDDAVAYLDALGGACAAGCRLAAASHSSGSSAASSSFASARSSAAASSVSDHSNATEKTGEWKAKGLHLMRATIRDQEGKRYLFVIGEEESWKIAKGLQTLRGGTQVRALGVSGFGALEAKNILETLGWGG